MLHQSRSLSNHDETGTATNKSNNAVVYFAVNGMVGIVFATQRTKPKIIGKWQLNGKDKNGMWRKKDGYAHRTLDKKKKDVDITKLNCGQTTPTDILAETSLCGKR
jgi:hypothetical protein